MFEQQRLKFRIYHDISAYFRTRVSALNVATARGWSGTVLLDEIPFMGLGRLRGKGVIA